MKEKIENIKKLPQNERIAGFLECSAKFTSIASRLRNNGREDSDWTSSEISMFDRACDQIDPWWHALSEDERDFVKPILIITSTIANGESIK